MAFTADIWIRLLLPEENGHKKTSDRFSQLIVDKPLFMDIVLRIEQMKKAGIDISPAYMLACLLYPLFVINSNIATSCHQAKIVLIVVNYFAHANWLYT